MKKKIGFLLCICLLVCLFGCDKKTEPQETAPSQDTVGTGTDESADESALPEDGYRLSMIDGDIQSDRDYVVCLEKERDKDFTILNLTDIQLSSTSVLRHDDSCDFLEKMLDQLITETQPDLITLTGDQGYGEPFSINYIGNLLDGYDIPWAPVLGNHDNDAVFLSPDNQVSLYENSFFHCLMKKGPENLAFTDEEKEASGNYIVNIVEKDDTKRGFHVVKSLIFLNSGNNQNYNRSDYTEDPVNGYNYASLSEQQIEWYKWAIRSVQPYGKDGQTSSAIFLHIPIFAYNTAYRYATETKTAIPGELRETICSTPYDDHVFDAVCDYDDNENTDYVSTDLVVAGHDHTNNFIVTYEKTTFVYGVKSGHTSYYDEDMQGGTVIRLTSSGKATVTHHFYTEE